MVTPSGCSGVQRSPERRAIGRLLLTAEHQPADAFAGALLALADGAEPVLSVEGGVRLGKRQPAFGDLADAPPAAMNDAEHLAHDVLRRAIAAALDRARVLILDLGVAGLELADAEIDAFEDIERFETRHDDRHMIAGSDGQIFLVTHDRADVAGGEKALDAIGRASENRRHRRRHQDMRDEQREIGEPLSLSAPRRHRVRRRGRLEPDGEEDHLAIRIGAGDGERVERRIDDPHVAAVGLGGQQVAVAPRHAQHVAERTEDRARLAGDLDRLVDVVDRSDAHRAARPVDQRHLRRQELVDAVTHDGMRLAAAHLHDLPRTGDHAGDGVGVATGGDGVAVFLAVLHAGCPAASSASISPIRSRCSKTLAASAASITVMAKPT